ncbi:unnamed protein product [Polarella glacialis]|uniref:Uncharacterized protein n=1 Tax=Polarella glacialis TaxID=89957 RepID=A0A813JLF6_POLGL|nr:unnamed protein product [Polarella glacialis]
MQVVACGSMASCTSKAKGRSLAVAVVSAAAVLEFELGRETSATSNSGFLRKPGQPHRRIFKRLSPTPMEDAEDSEGDCESKRRRAPGSSKDGVGRIFSTAADGGGLRAKPQPLQVNQKQDGTEKAGKGEQMLQLKADVSDSGDRDGDCQSWKSDGNSSHLASEGSGVPRSDNGTGIEGFLRRRRRASMSSVDSAVHDSAEESEGRVAPLTLTSISSVDSAGHDLADESEGRVETLMLIPIVDGAPPDGGWLSWRSDSGSSIASDDSCPLPSLSGTRMTEFLQRRVSACSVVSSAALSASMVDFQDDGSMPE